MREDVATLFRESLHLDRRRGHLPHRHEERERGGEKKEFVRSFATVIINLPFKPWLALQLRVWPMEMPDHAFW